MRPLFAGTNIFGGTILPSNKQIPKLIWLNYACCWILVRHVHSHSTQASVPAEMTRGGYGNVFWHKPQVLHTDLLRNVLRWLIDEFGWRWEFRPKEKTCNKVTDSEGHSQVTLIIWRSFQNCSCKKICAGRDAGVGDLKYPDYIKNISLERCVRTYSGITEDIFSNSELIFLFFLLSLTKHLKRPLDRGTLRVKFGSTRFEQMHTASMSSLID